MKRNLPLVPGLRASRRLLAFACLALMPGVAAAQDAFRFVVIGDSRQHTCNYDTAPPVDCINHKVLAQINKDILALEPRPALLIVNGDLARYGGTKFYEAWKGVMQPVKDAGIPIYVTFGNHELHTNKGLSYQGQVDFQNAFSDMPQNGPTGYEGLAYSFTHGNSFFLILDTFFATPTFQSEEPYITPDQFAWSDAQTATANANPAVVHKFAISHAPVFSAESAHYASYTREAWIGIDNNGYDAFFGAHEHLYARLKVNELVVRPDAASAWHGNVVHVIAGVAGGPLDETPIGNTDVTQIQFGYTVVDVQGKDIAVNSFNYDDTKRAIDSFTVRKQTLTVGRTGTGAGAVQSDQPVPYVDCGTTCTAHFNQDATVTLTAVPDANSIFAGWQGGCWGIDTSCTVKMSGDMTVGAAFRAKPALIVRKLGFGSDWGSVVGAAAGIDCGPTCTVQANPGTKVVLKATPTSGATFSGWSGACTGAQDTCTVVMDAGRSVLATFGAAP